MLLSKIRELLNRIDNISTKKQRKYSQVIDDIDCGIYSMAKQEICEALSLIRAEEDCLNELYLCIPDVPEGPIIKEGSFIDRVTIHSRYIHIRLYRRLPSRIKHSGRDKMIKNMAACFGAELDTALRGTDMMEEKAVIFFYSHFKNSTSAKDHDNMEVKFIIDEICAHLLYDDGPEFCSHYYDGIVDGRDYTDIYIAKDADFPELLTLFRVR